jgi:hypothetical protein
MKDVIRVDVLKAFIESLEQDCREPEAMNGSPDAAINNAHAQGVRDGIARTIDMLETAVNLFKIEVI